MSIEIPPDVVEVELRDIRLTSYARAIEHALWCAGQGMLPRDVVRSVGHDWPRAVTWDDAVFALADAWRRHHFDWPGRPAMPGLPRRQRARVRATPTAEEVVDCRREATRRASGRTT